MSHLFFDETKEVKAPWRRLLQIGLILYLIVIIYLCFQPQPHLFKGIQTPNVFAVGRLKFLLVPFNTLWSLGDVSGGLAKSWVVAQNVMNIFLLYPALFIIHFLSSRWRSARKSLLLGFLMSLTIELTQLLLDQLIDANRVFELDDLLTNTLGALLAFYTYDFVIKRVKHD
ncbi:VanZ family protein [Streptococcus ictaluri]|uniref:VanZ-like protein n=1 Tax=Streptococcus ictaluri 707-05 TaxID=764299 RepID=G5K0Y6_9STRE|nr:VanZ family protein [Streptococcus ictaluri]EHI70381.1 VanZ-like protein [Streptococcus ictaluri 707-05]